MEMSELWHVCIDNKTGKRFCYYIGQTGNASGVHLHFELRKNSTRKNPTSVIGGLK